MRSAVTEVLKTFYANESEDYLGFQAIGANKKNDSLRALKDKIRDKLQGWHYLSLNSIGIVLIKLQYPHIL